MYICLIVAGYRPSMNVHDGVPPIDSSSSSSAESPMGDNTSNGRRQTHTLTKAHSLTTTDHNLVFAHSLAEAEGENHGAIADKDDLDVENSEMWNTFTDSFQRVQSVLDRNRVLIQQVNENHQSKIHDNLVKNVSLIQEINGNINQVVSLYSDLSVNFSNMCYQRNPAIQSKDQAGKTTDS